jgi:hypothetical protein
MEASEAMKACPFCGEQILAVAIKCKHCSSIIDAPKPPVAAVISPPTDAPSSKPAGKGEGLGLILVGAGVVFGIAGASTSSGGVSALAFPLAWVGLAVWFKASGKKKGKPAGFVKAYLGSFILALVLVAFFAGMASGVNGDKSPSSRSSTSAQAPSATEPVIRVSIAQILRDYKANEVAADEKYKGQVIEVTGVVGEIKKDITDSIYVTLGTTGDEFEIPVVQAFFDDAWKGQASSLQKGQRLTIRGRVNGLMMNVLVKDSEIVR